MEFKVTQVQGAGFTQVSVSHEGHVLEWSARAYSKVKLADPNRVFKELNGYMENVPPHIQSKIFNAYVEIHKLFGLGFSPEMLSASLVHHIGEIYKHLPMNSLRRWLLTIGNLHIPNDIQDTINADSRYNKREQTYLKADYINNATVALATQAMIPVWGEYMDQCTDQELYKENHVVALVANTEMANWPIGEKDTMGEEIPTVFDKLAGYVKYCMQNEPLNLALVWAGLSSTNVRVLLHSKILVRRLTIIPLNDPSSHSIVANIFRYVMTNLKPAERSTADRVAKKLPEGVSGDDEDKTSFIESHKMKSRISPGDIEAYNLDAMDYELLAEEVDPTICKQKLKQCISCIPDVTNVEIRPHQILIAQWVMAKAFPSRAFYHVSKLPVNYLLATTQALLWHWGFKDVAILMQVEPLKHGEHNSAIQLSQTRQGSRIANRYRAQLDELYPHMKLQKVPQNGSETPKPENMAGLAINSCNQSIRSSNWIYHGPRKLYDEAGQVTSNQVLILPQTIKHTITEVVLHLAQINQ